MGKGQFLFIGDAVSLSEDFLTRNPVFGSRWLNQPSSRKRGLVPAHTAPSRPRRTQSSAPLSGSWDNGYTDYQLRFKTRYLSVTLGVCSLSREQHRNFPKMEIRTLFQNTEDYGLFEIL
ncbi:hypothetical protein VTO42DRAFT_6164 [Malbranchea cinnamomea]